MTHIDTTWSAISNANCKRKQQRDGPQLPVAQFEKSAAASNTKEEEKEEAKEAMTRTCTSCGVETPGTTARFCANCGAKYPETEDTVFISPPVVVAVPAAPAPSYQSQPVPAYQLGSPPAYNQLPPAPAAMAQNYNEKNVFNGPPPPPPPAQNQQQQPYQGQQEQQPALFGTNPSNHDMTRGSSSSDEGQVKGGFLKSRYADHPNCDVCRTGFDIAKRRHQCRRCGRYVCGTCSPAHLLIPYGQQIEGAKGYDTSIPQRVCLHCAPELHPLQDQLAAQYARSNLDNEHEAKSRIHVPYTDSLAKECQNAADIIGNFFRNDNAASSDRSIPISFLEKAQGLAIMTIVKAGFLITGKIGTGLVVARLPDGSWSAPSAIGTAGLGGGFQIGGEIVELMIILGTHGAVEVFYKPQVNLGAGLDVAVGPYGRAASADAAMNTDKLEANYSYSQSKGLFAGIALQGSVIAARTDLNRKFYGRDLEPKELLNGSVAQPPAARPLYEAIDRAMQDVQELRAVQEELSTMMGSCRRCTCQKYVAHVHQIWNKKCKTCDHVH